MIPTRWPDWSAAAESAYTKLAANCDDVAVVALSMGGTLASWLAEHHPEIRGLALVNPFIDPRPRVSATSCAACSGREPTSPPASAPTSPRRG